MSQKDQVQLLERFRSGEVNCLVATSVAEEGLDVPSTDLVVFYEPVPDLIRTIQRRGRTGRARAGRVVVLVAEGTRDVGLARSSGGKERRMHEMLERLEDESRAGTLPPPAPKAVQRNLEEFRAPQRPQRPVLPNPPAREPTTRTVPSSKTAGRSATRRTWAIRSPARIS